MTNHRVSDEHRADYRRLAQGQKAFNEKWSDRKGSCEVAPEIMLDLLADFDDDQKEIERLQTEIKFQKDRLENSGYFIKLASENLHLQAATITHLKAENEQWREDYNRSERDYKNAVADRNRLTAERDEAMAKKELQNEELCKLSLEILNCATRIAELEAQLGKKKEFSEPYRRHIETWAKFYKTSKNS